MNIPLFPKAGAHRTSENGPGKGELGPDGAEKADTVPNIPAGTG